MKSCPCRPILPILSCQGGRREAGRLPREATPGGRPLAGDTGRQAGDVLFRTEPIGVSNAASGWSAPADLATLFRGWGQLRANDSRWPMFDGKYVNNPCFKKEWMAYREAYHSIVNEDLAVKA